MLPLDDTFRDFIFSRFGPLDDEALLLVYLGRTGAFLGDELIAGGSKCAHGIPYRRLFERAFNCGAARLVLAHNHPSGSAVPSKLDIASTRGLQALAMPMDIEIVDHLIVGAREIFSMRAAGLLVAESGRKSA